MTPQTALRNAVITLGAGLLQLAVAADFETTVKASAEAAMAEQACVTALQKAESEAFLQADEFFDGPFRLEQSAQQENRRKGTNDTAICEIEGTWTGQPVRMAAELIGTEESISGKFQASCLDTSHGDLCWSRLIQQAENKLLQTLTARYGSTDSIALQYSDFEGWQRDQFHDKRLEITADGTFFFDVIPATDSQTRITIQRSYDVEPTAPQNIAAAPDTKPAPPAEERDQNPDLLDLTLFYTWDGNDSANNNALAISTERWGVGLWANNRLGFAVFKGQDRFGIANDRGWVKNSSAHYDTFGVGMGYRLWRNRGITLENMIYYVDAQPYQTTLDLDCDGCTARSVQSDDYLQATVNVKTNSRGINIGWMFTWKILEAEPALDTLSSGFYLELQI